MINVSRRRLGLAASGASADLCLPYARIAAQEKHAGIGMGWSAPMDSDVIFHVFEPMPRQDFRSSTADELNVLTRSSLLLNSSNHAGKSLPEVAAVRTGGTQCWHRCIQAFEKTAKLGSVHGPEYRQCGRTA
ncbi:hypothetical protein J7432_21505 [Xanthomonas axonopodis pv. begoniae]|nr:hypothetical protein [Xanthomonas axonopodis pv. begoniae]MBO9773830.1 hypothetical protein [Xanthomonas axonopodis pv. begoniae]